MSVVMYAAGAALSFVGVILVAVGLPDKEFSFGNTLIIAGTFCFTGGLIIAALGAVVAQLQRLTENRPSLPMPQPASAREADVPQLPASDKPRIPFPSRPKARAAETRIEQAPEPLELAEPDQAEPPARNEFSGGPFAPLDAPMMSNPVEPPQINDSETSEVPLSPRQPASGSARPSFEPPLPRFGQGPQAPFTPAEPSRPRQENWKASDTGRPAAPVGDSRFFEAMWPSKPRHAPPPAPESPPRFAPPSRALEPMPEPPRAESVIRAPSPPPLSEPEEIEPTPAPVSAVPVLRTGVVEGMAYTLYVDGSIEAELPSGKLHFASINELRSHLASNTA
ncbi:MAG: hypothetical protein JO245_01355 [Pseudolabrys sp.]|nr:hypothetical protein [Pseudolabrys sp.]